MAGRAGLGVDIGDLIPRGALTLDDLRGKAIAFDAYNTLYQFLSIIRGIDGEPLRDREGRITSHLSGLFYRTANLLERGIKPAYVFDGKPPSLKEAEVRRRAKLKEEASAKYEEALRKGDLGRARMYAQATARLEDTMVDDAKRLLTQMGVPWVQAPSEGEAQAAHMVAKGDAWAVGSQDFDSLLFGAPKLVRNVAVTGKRKLPRKPIYVKVSPELIELSEVLSSLGITREQLVEIGILVGTDFNPEGVRGVGPRKALTLLKEFGSLERALAAVGPVDFDWAEVRDAFLKPQVTDHRLVWRTPDVEGVVSFLCHERSFDQGRVRKALSRALSGMEAAERGLESFLG